MKNLTYSELKELAKNYDESIEEILRKAELNLDIVNIVLDTLRICGFTPIDIEYGCGHLITSYLYSTVEFKIKELSSKWRFGLWVNGDGIEDIEKLKDKAKYKEYSIACLFCQHEYKIDKFTPSRSDLLVEWKYDEFKYWIGGYDGDTYGTSEDQYRWGDLNYQCFKNALESMLKFIKKHPVLAYEGTCHGGGESYECTYLDCHPIPKYLCSWKHNKYIELKSSALMKYGLMYMKYKCAQLKRYSIVDSVNIRIDLLYSPKILCHVVIEESADLGEFNEMMDEVFKYWCPNDIQEFFNIDGYRYACGFEFFVKNGGMIIYE